MWPFKKKTPFDALKEKIRQTKKDIEQDKKCVKDLKEAEWFNRSYSFIGTAPYEMIDAHARGKGHFDICRLPQDEFFDWISGHHDTRANTFSNFLFDLIEELGLHPRVKKNDSGQFIIRVVFVEGAYFSDDD